MARDLNHATLVGRLVRDPEVRYSQSGVAIAKLSIANNDTIKKDNQWQDEVSYFDIVVFGNQAVNCEKYLKKGSQVAIEGRLRQNRWVDQASGQNRSKIEIVASSIQFLTTASQSSGMQQQVGGQAQQQPMQQQYQQPPQQQQMRSQGPVPGNNQQFQDPGFITDPWGDSGSSQNNNDPYMSQDSDDDIPF